MNETGTTSSLVLLLLLRWRRRFFFVGVVASTSYLEASVSRGRGLSSDILFLYLTLSLVHNRCKWLDYIKVKTMADYFAQRLKGRVINQSQPPPPPIFSLLRIIKTL